MNPLRKHFLSNHRTLVEGEEFSEVTSHQKVTDVSIGTTIRFRDLRVELENPVRQGHAAGYQTIYLLQIYSYHVRLSNYSNFDWVYRGNPIHGRPIIPEGLCAFFQDRVCDGSLLGALLQGVTRSSKVSFYMYVSAGRLCRV